MKFLVDECLSPALVDEAQDAGFEAYHLAHIGGASWPDWRITAHAVARDMILVTNNAADFRTLYAHQQLHPGLVIMIPSIRREQQRVLFRSALDRLAEVRDLTNKVLEAHVGPGGARFELYDFPPSSE